MGPPCALLGGVIVQVMHRYIPLNFFGFSLMMIGMGIMSLYTAHVTEAQLVGYQIIQTVGIGLQVSIPFVVHLQQRCFTETV